MSRPRLTYIIVEVEEPERPDGYTGGTRAGMVRSLLHKSLTDKGITGVRDMIIRYDQETTHYGQSNLWPAFNTLYEAVVPARFVKKGRET